MKDNIDDLLNLTKDIEKGVKQTINYMTLLSTAELIAVYIKNRAKNGLGVRLIAESDSSLKPLKDSTIKRRKKLQELGWIS